MCNYRKVFDIVVRKICHSILRYCKSKKATKKMDLVARVDLYSKLDRQQ